MHKQSGVSETEVARTQAKWCEKSETVSGTPRKHGSAERADGCIHIECRLLVGEWVDCAHVTRTTEARVLVLWRGRFRCRSCSHGLISVSVWRCANHERGGEVSRAVSTRSLVTLDALCVCVLLPCWHPPHADKTTPAHAVGPVAPHSAQKFSTHTQRKRIGRQGPQHTYVLALV